MRIIKIRRNCLTDQLAALSLDTKFLALEEASSLLFEQSFPKGEEYMLSYMSKFGRFSRVFLQKANQANSIRF